jgi:HEAT repeat protein
MMKTNYLGLALLMLGSHAWAQIGELSNADLTEQTSISNPAKVMKAAEGQWLAFSMPALEGTHSPCCWKGNWNGVGDVGCSLESQHQSYGSRSDSPIAENVIVFSKIQAGEVEDIRVVGESCPVDAGGAKVTWLGDVDEKHSLDWLQNAAQSDADHSALHALAIHRSPLAGQRLYDLAKTNSHDLSEQAIFWLGNSRGEEGFGLLEKLLVDLPTGENRRQINFALAQNNTTEAAELLFEISKSDADPEQRGEAMFWLAQEYPLRAADWLLDVIATEQNEAVLEQAVFAISQLPDGKGDKVLLELAQDAQQTKAVRRQALFWLANSDNDSSVAALAELLTR